MDEYLDLDVAVGVGSGSGEGSRGIVDPATPNCFEGEAVDDDEEECEGFCWWRWWMWSGLVWGGGGGGGGVGRFFAGGANEKNSIFDGHCSEINRSAGGSLLFPPSLCTSVLAHERSK